MTSSAHPSTTARIFPDRRTGGWQLAATPSPRVHRHFSTRQDAERYARKIYEADDTPGVEIVVLDMYNRVLSRR